MKNPIGSFIREQRKQAGLTQEEFAFRFGLGLRFTSEPLKSAMKDMLIQRLKRLID